MLLEEAVHLLQNKAQVGAATSADMSCMVLVKLHAAGLFRVQGLICGVLQNCCLDEEAAGALEELLESATSMDGRATKLLPVLISLRVQVTAIVSFSAQNCMPQMKN